MKTTEINDRGFASISTPDGRFRMWVPRPTAGGKITCSCGFALGEYLPFTDAVDALAYVRVEEIRHIDEGFGYMVSAASRNHGSVWNGCWRTFRS